MDSAHVGPDDLADGPLPAASVLNFKSLHEIEDGWDYGYVQVSTDGGANWTNLPGAITTSESEWLEPGQRHHRRGGVDGRDVRPGAVRGQTVKIRFAYVCDHYVSEAGWKIDAIAVGPTGAPVFTDDVETVKPISSQLGGVHPVRSRNRVLSSERSITRSSEGVKSHVPAQLLGEHG